MARLICFPRLVITALPIVPILILAWSNRSVGHSISEATLSSDGGAPAPHVQMWPRVSYTGGATSDLERRCLSVWEDGRARAIDGDAGIALFGAFFSDSAPPPPVIDFPIVDDPLLRYAYVGNPHAAYDATLRRFMVVHTVVPSLAYTWLSYDGGSWTTDAGGVIADGGGAISDAGGILPSVAYGSGYFGVVWREVLTSTILARTMTSAGVWGAPMSLSDAGRARPAITSISSVPIHPTFFIECAGGTCEVVRRDIEVSAVISRVVVSDDASAPVAPSPTGDFSGYIDVSSIADGGSSSAFVAWVGAGGVFGRWYQTYPVGVSASPPILISSVRLTTRIAVSGDAWREQFFSLQQVLSNLAMVLGSLVGGAIITLTDNTKFSYHYVFLVSAAMRYLASLSVLFFIREIRTVERVRYRDFAYVFFKAAQNRGMFYVPDVLKTRSSREEM